MPQTIEEKVIEAVRVLPETKQIQVLTYVKQIGQKKSIKNEQPKKKKHLEKLEELRTKLPEGAFQNSPTDGSLNHDHYLYGSPKREKE